MTAPGDKQDPIWNEALDWLLRVHAAPGDAELRAGLKAWLAQSEDHARAWRRAERTWRLMGEVPPVHEGRWADYASANDGGRRRRARRGFIGGLVAVAMAASLALAFLPALRVLVEADYVTDVGEIRRVALDDGTVVFLDTDSAVDIRFTPSRRAVALLSGQAFFQVVSDSDRPFVLEAGTVSVTVVGTAFDVRLASDDVDVAVQSGRVSVAIAHPAGPPQEVVLAPGERLQVDRATGAVIREMVAGSRIAAWRDGRLVVDGATVGQVVDELARYHRGMILLRDDALAGRRVTGVYDLRDPAAALRAVVRPHGGRVQELSPYLLIVPDR